MMLGIEKMVGGCGMGALSKMKKMLDFAKDAGVRPAPFPVDAWTDPSYQTWYEESKADAAELNKQRTGEFPYAATFSLIVPLYRTPLDYLHDMAESVLSQTYQNFELLLVNASPDDPSLKDAVRSLCEADARVREIALCGNYGITENTNAGIENAQGEFVCFLDHDDFLEPNALFEFAEAIYSEPQTDILYCDEDLVEITDGKCRHLHPLFKPAFSPELLLCKNYAMHLLTVRRSILEEIPRPQSVFDGSQDYNILLQASERARMVKHVAKVLYHWRISDNSTATNPESKPYTKRSNRLAIQGHLERTSQHATLFSSGISNLHNLWFEIDRKPLVSVVLLQIGSDDRLRSSVESFIQSNSYEPCELIVVTDHEPSSLHDEDSMPVRCVRVPEGRSVDRLDVLNYGVEAASGEYVLFLNDGLSFTTSEPLEQLLGLCMRDFVGAVSAKVLYAGGEVRYYGIAATSDRIMPLYRGYPDDFPGYQCNLRCFQNVGAASHECMMTPRSLFLSLGGFDASYRDVVGSVDYCKRLMSSGYRIVQTPVVKAESIEICPDDRYNSVLNSPEFNSDDIAVFYRKWPDTRITGDPFFNGNLNQSSCYMQVSDIERAL